MKRLKGYISDRDGRTPFEAEEIVLELGADRVIVIKRALIRGSDGLSLGCGIERDHVVSNGRFVLRPSSFNNIEITVEAAK